MKRYSIVIGSFFGDEGKGHMTDILCRQKGSLNVRFNGGAQASHTVVTPDGKRHAFRHFGAGTFSGSKTYLSKHFLVNPIAFVFERNELIKNFELIPCEYVNPNCLVTTPWDIYINQIVEELRGENRHGSCGFGINETVERSKFCKYKITVLDLISKEKLRKKLLLIQNEYVKLRLKEEYNLQLEDLPHNFQMLLTEEKNLEMFMFYADEFISNVGIFEDSIINKFENVVFEGAQGLLLDQENSEYFPHVTTSNTGIKNVMEILNVLKCNEQIDIYYMSRCYITRHGRGPLNNELKEKPYKKIEDLTNVPNEYQGELRFSYLDFDLLSSEINKDLKNLSVPANINVTFTCIDQADEFIKYYEGSELRTAKSKQFLKIAWEILRAKIKNLNGIYATNGLTRDCIISYKDKNET